MKVIIVEDENTVALRLKRLTEELFTEGLLGEQLTSIKLFYSLDDANDYLANNDIDLLFLDLNLGGHDGFQLLKQVVAKSFHTVVVSAYAERAIEAFEYGVLDFVAKPFTKSRLEKALLRYSTTFQQQQTKYISVKRRGIIEVINLSDVCYFQGANIYSDVYLNDGTILLHDKSLAKLAQLLPPQFDRIHKSFIVNKDQVKGIKPIANNAVLVMKNGEEIPVSRSKIALLKAELI